MHFALFLVLFMGPMEPPTPRQIEDLARLAPEEIRAQLGPPTRRARQILYQRYLEQWVYEAPVGLRIEIEWPRGQKPIVRSVERLNGPLP